MLHTSAVLLTLRSRGIQYATRGTARRLPATSRFNGQQHRGLATARQPPSAAPPPPPPATPVAGNGLIYAGLAGVVGFVLGQTFSEDGFLFGGNNPTSPDASAFGKFGTPEDFKAATDDLRSKLTDLKVSTDPDVSYHPAIAHSVVVFPASTQDVVETMKIATKYRMPVVAYSGGTSLEGHFAGIEGGCICVDMSGMNQILRINVDDADVVVQSGISWEDLNANLKDKEIPLFFPLDPGPGATIGGMAGTGCSGTNAVKYGTAKSHWFINLTVVLPNGEVIKTRSRARKSSAGFDLTKIFIGAEGTLGIVTEATLRLAPYMPTSVAVAQFPDVRKAASAVQEALISTAGDAIQCVELVDDNFMVATNKFGQSQRKYLEKDSLFFKIQGSPSHIKENAKIIEKIVKKHGGLTFELAKNDQQAAELWQDRKNALWSSLSLVPGSKGWSTDVCVPVSRLPDLVYDTKKDLKDHGIASTIVGHVGDGNFHALLIFADDAELPKIHDAVHRMVHRAIDMEGTCTGEHGVGIGKKEFLYRELGEGTVNLMKKIKKTVDPLGIMNPGKLYPDDPKGDMHVSPGHAKA
ncbi:hypothetical protein FRB99_004654 [Tulasnella sp. 403]|nr:hypothetical protein FRB99_004654 [Tulasnella sp. 403]